MPTLSAACRKALDAGMDRLDTQLLMLHALGKASHDRAWLVAHDQDTLTAHAARTFAEICQRRASGEPLAYIVGHKEFFGLTLKVDSRVLVPRPDTETLVQWALDLAQASTDNAPRLLDLGTGSGAVALALAAQLMRLGFSPTLVAVDSSVEALTVARANARQLGLDNLVEFMESDWFANIESDFDIIVSNPPYINDGDSHLLALTHEPLKALTAGADGLRDIRQIVAQAPAHLRHGGWLLLEHGHDQAPRVQDLLSQRGFTQMRSVVDLGGHERCSGGQWHPGA